MRISHVRLRHSFSLYWIDYQLKWFPFRWFVYGYEFTQEQAWKTVKRLHAAKGINPFTGKLIEEPLNANS